MISSLSTKGYMAFPVCKDNVTYSWHVGKVCYLSHCRWLLWDDEWRQNDKAFDGTTKTRPRPREWLGDEILDQVKCLDFGLFSKRVSKTKLTTHLNWTHKSMLFELPHWSKLKWDTTSIVCMFWKNVLDTLIGTILDIKKNQKTWSKLASIWNEWA